MLKAPIVLVLMLAVLGTVIPAIADELPIINNPPAKQEAEKAANSKENSKTKNQNPTSPAPIINPTSSPPLQEIRNDKYCKYDEEKKSSWWNFSLTDALLVVFTCGLVIVGWLQVRILRGTLKVTDGLLGVAQEQSKDMKDSIAAAQKAADAALESAEVAKETLTSIQRAFVWCKDIKTLKILDPQGIKVLKWRFTAHFENSGNTPAINMSVQVSWKPTIPLAQEYDFTLTPQARTLGAHAIVQIGHLFVTPDKIRDAKTFCIYGIITYNDIIKDTPLHVEKFCEEIVIADPFDITPETDISFISHPTPKDKTNT